MLPIIPNSSRLFGLQSAFAPASTRSDGSPPKIGYMLASAGRSIPCILPKIKSPPERSAPVLPAEIKISPSPFFTIFIPFTIEESFFERTALTGASSFVITSRASATVILSWLYLYFLSSWFINSSCPIITISWSISLEARTAPSTIAPGALSPPMPSKIILIGKPPVMYILIQILSYHKKRKKPIKWLHFSWLF